MVVVGVMVMTVGGGNGDVGVTVMVVVGDGGIKPANTRKSKDPQ